MEHTPPPETAMSLDVNLIYIMGGCFVLGSMVTLFLLLALDFIRRDKTPPEE